MTDNWMGMATIAAVFLWPVFAVLVACCIDKLRADKARKLDIFRTLMRTRGIQLHPDHVGALNLLGVEFRNHRDVMKAWKAYRTKLREEMPPIEQKNRYDVFVEDRDALLAELIDEIAKVLGIKIKQLDIFKGHYLPLGWAEAEWEQTLARRGLIDVLYGKRAISIQPLQTQQGQSLYPPPPEPK